MNTCLSHFCFPLAGSFYLKELCFIVARASGTVLSSRATPKVMFGRISLHSLSFIYSYLAVAMTIALAVICVAILLAVILIIILCRRNRKEKERLEHNNEWVYATVLSLTYQNGQEPIRSINGPLERDLTPYRLYLLLVRASAVREIAE